MAKKTPEDWSPVGAELLVKDFKLAKEFYVNRLGLKIVREDHNRSVTVSSGKMMLCIDLESEEESARRGGATVFFQVKDADSTARKLKQRGITFKLDNSRKHPAIISNDPEGYRLVFTEKL